MRSHPWLSASPTLCVAATSLICGEMDRKKKGKETTYALKYKPASKEENTHTNRRSALKVRSAAGKHLGASLDEETN